jgi:cytochrome P450
MSQATVSDNVWVPKEFNLLDAKIFANGHPWSLYRKMRECGRLIRHNGAGDIPDFWVATHHDDIRAVSHDTQRFTSNAGFNFPAAGKYPPPAVASAISRNIINFDPPDHTAFKQMLMPAFSPARMKALEEHTRAFVTELLDQFQPGQDVEFVRDISSVIPIRVLCDLLGIPKEDENKILAWTNLMVGVNDPEISSTPEQSLKAFMEVFAYGKWLIKKRREDPKEDLMTLVANGELGGQLLDETVLDGMCATLIAAGNETTRNAITGSILLLAEEPAALKLLADRADLTGNAVEEFLRLTTPIIHMMRTAKTDVNIAGQHISKGEHVALLYGAANHDPDIFADPERLNLERSEARKHLAFGTGIHLCIGQRVAQLEMRILLPEVIRRFKNIDILEAPRYLLSNFVSGIKKLSVRLS